MQSDAIRAEAGLRRARARAACLMREAISVAISGHQWKGLGRKSSACRRGGWVSLVWVGFRSGFVSVGWVSFGVSFGQWWGSGEVLGSGGGSRADAKVEACGSDDQLRDVALRHVRGHLMRGAISGHQRSSEVIRGQQRSSEVISGKSAGPPRRHGSRDGRGH